MEILRTISFRLAPNCICINKNMAPPKRKLGRSTHYPTSIKHERKDPTLFQKRVYDATKKIPSGFVSTYGDIARLLNTSSRAVGNALRNNPYAPKVPCHRVVASTRELYGFDGQCGKDAPNLLKKRKLLEDEGVEFEQDSTRASIKCMWDTKSYTVNQYLEDLAKKNKANKPKRIKRGFKIVKRR
uniref:Methylated-DNA--protein-cysteine methyltransferase n=1 Tax=Aplanochytrium stocchinoi TaxID=215587 RepID=A0A7S3PFJ2_9STRA